MEEERIAVLRAQPQFTAKFTPPLKVRSYQGYISSAQCIFSLFQSLVRQLLQEDPSIRPTAVRAFAHPLFRGLSKEKISGKRVVPPFKPGLYLCGI
jgi:hypothetical protein